MQQRLHLLRAQRRQQEPLWHRRRNALWWGSLPTVYAESRGLGGGGSTRGKEQVWGDGETSIVPQEGFMYRRVGKRTPMKLRACGANWRATAAHHYCRRTDILGRNSWKHCGATACYLAFHRSWLPLHLQLVRYICRYSSTQRLGAHSYRSKRLCWALRNTVVSAIVIDCMPATAC